MRGASCRNCFQCRVSAGNFAFSTARDGQIRKGGRLSETGVGAQGRARGKVRARKSLAVVQGHASTLIINFSCAKRSAREILLLLSLIIRNCVCFNVGRVTYKKSSDDFFQHVWLLIDDTQIFKLVSMFIYILNIVSLVAFVFCELIRRFLREVFSANLQILKEAGFQFDFQFIRLFTIIRNFSADCLFFKWWFLSRWLDILNRMSYFSI